MFISKSFCCSLIAGLVCLCLWQPASAQTKSYLRPAVGTGGYNPVNEMTLGLVYSRYKPYHEYAQHNLDNNVTAEGVQAGLGTSFVLNYFAPQRNHRLRIGDVFRASLLAGYRSGGPSQSPGAGLWTGYRFEIGIHAFYEISQEVSAGLRLLPLIFARDQITPNISGSSLSLWLRAGHVVGEVGGEARSDRVLGFTKILSPDTSIPNQFHLMFTYLVNTNNKAGLELVSFPYPNQYLIQSLGDLQPKNATSLRVFYGRSF